MSVQYVKHYFCITCYVSAVSITYNIFQCSTVSVVGRAYFAVYGRPEEVFENWITVGVTSLHPLNCLTTFSVLGHCSQVKFMM